MKETSTARADEYGGNDGGVVTQSDLAAIGDDGRWGHFAEQDGRAGRRVSAELLDTVGGSILPEIENKRGGGPS